MGHEPDGPSLWSQLTLCSVIGLPALAVALLCTSFVWTYTGPRYCVAFINDHAIGGTSDRIVAMLLATGFGGIGIFCVRSARAAIDSRREAAAQAQIAAARREG